MQPLKPEDKEKIREENPQAAPEDIERYEQLLSQRFTVDPDAPSAAPLRAYKAGVGDQAEEATDAGENIERELRQLHTRLFASNSKTRAAHH